MCTVGTHAINPAIYTRMPYDPVRDFTAITNLVMLPTVLVVHPSIPVRSVKELIALARKRPGELSYSSAGSGSQPHLTAEMFKSMTKTDLLHVPYKGAAQQMTDLLAGHVALTFATATSGVHVREVGRPRGSIGCARPCPTRASKSFPESVISPSSKRRTR